jgi:hypothetical protein
MQDRSTRFGWKSAARAAILNKDYFHGFSYSARENRASAVTLAMCVYCQILNFLLLVNIFAKQLAQSKHSG